MKHLCLADLMHVQRKVMIGCQIIQHMRHCCCCFVDQTSPTNQVFGWNNTFPKRIEHQTPRTSAIFWSTERTTRCSAQIGRRVPHTWRCHVHLLKNFPLMFRNRCLFEFNEGSRLWLWLFKQRRAAFDWECVIASRDAFNTREQICSHEIIALQGKHCAVWLHLCMQQDEFISCWVDDVCHEGNDFALPSFDRVFFLNFKRPWTRT